MQVNYDDAALGMVSVVYQNATDMRAIVSITQGQKSDTFTVLPQAGVPNPITQSIPHNRYTYTLNAKGDLAPDFVCSVTFEQ